MFQRCRPHAVRVRHTHARSVAVAGCVCRSIPPSANFVFICTEADVHPVHFFVLLHGARTTAQTAIGTVHRACLPPASYSTTTLLPSSSSSGHTFRVSMIVLRILLWVIQHCHCSRCAQHSAPTAAAGWVLCACGRSALYAQYYCSVRCCCQRHWPMHAYLPQCVTGIFCSVPIIPDMFVDSCTTKTNHSYKHRVHTVAIVQNILTVV